eukprot:GILK01016231.1.p1 GENE.GILK01016231.1~~GILK01016231.1.p1  ORF type:complete len:494 (-),score=52.78 GILK01016231.1:182-1633(-)
MPTRLEPMVRPAAGSSQITETAIPAGSVKDTDNFIQLPSEEPKDYFVPNKREEVAAKPFNKPTNLLATPDATGLRRPSLNAFVFGAEDEEFKKEFKEGSAQNNSTAIPDNNTRPQTSPSAEPLTDFLSFPAIGVQRDDAAVPEIFVFGDKDPMGGAYLNPNSSANTGKPQRRPSNSPRRVSALYLTKEEGERRLINAKLKRWKADYAKTNGGQFPKESVALSDAFAAPLYKRLQALREQRSHARADAAELGITVEESEAIFELTGEAPSFPDAENDEHDVFFASASDFMASASHSSDEGFKAFGGRMSSESSPQHDGFLSTTNAGRLLATTRARASISLAKSTIEVSALEVALPSSQISKNDLKQRRKTVVESIKQYKKKWMEEHDGQKPKESDLKADPSIAAVFADYKKMEGTHTAQLAEDVDSQELVPATKTEAEEADEPLAALFQLSPIANDDEFESQAPLRRQGTLAGQRGNHVRGPRI